MATLHALRRQHALPFSELARLTGIPARRLAAFEYHEQPLSPQERERVAAFFGIPSTLLRHGTSKDLPESLRSSNPPPIVATLAVAATIALSLRLNAPVDMLSSPSATLAPAQVAPTALQRSIAAESNVQRNHTSAPSRPTAIDEPPRHESGAAPSQRTRGVSARGEDRQTASAESVTGPALPRPESLSEQGPRPVGPVMLSGGYPLRGWNARIFTLRAAQRDQVRSFQTASESVPAVELRSITFESVMAPTDESSEAMPEPAALPTPTPETLGVSRMGTAVKRAPLAAPGVPDRCPLAPWSGRVIITQGYDAGTHAPAQIWGGLDLAASSGPTAGAPVIATHAGYAQVVLDSWPGGNYVSITGEAGWRTAYAHLQEVFVASGQFIEAGTVIGTAGSTGNSTGPHLHYETWRDGVNVNPAPVLNCN